MIFDTDQYKKLEKRHKDQSIYFSPPILLRYAHDHYAREKIFLEKTIAEVPQEKRKQLINDLLSKQWGNHMGAWFEINLYDWLKKSCLLSPEFTDGRDKPDLKIKNHLDFYIEAKAILKSDTERSHEHQETFFLDQLRQIHQPAILMIYKLRLKSLDDIPTIIKDIEHLIINKKFERTFLSYENGNFLEFEINTNTDDPDASVLIVGPVKTRSIKPNRLKNPVKNKYSKYSSLRHSKNSYIVAVFLEDSFFDHEDVRFAIFGKDTYYIDPQTNKIVGSSIDMKGIHYHQNQFKYQSIGGILVFKERYDAEQKRRTIYGYFIENPYSTDSKKVSSGLFNTISDFLVIGRSENIAHMKWVNKNE